MSRSYRYYRYVPWKITPDPLTRPDYRADCVTGQEPGKGSGCGEMIRSGGLEWVEEWMRRHTEETGHTDYCRTVADYVTMAAPEGCGGGRPVIGEAAPTRLVLPSRPTSGGEQ
ncbi:hypothetical protein AB0I22_25000 [Streptomyces sp. NPDC050610]|uniref:DUF7848 domain-containing protein n=1 Tax=Streptomyces sp. NPDC050610 TaxID=3157097 RepID=UPI003448B685